MSLRTTTTILNANSLTAELLDRWQHLQQSNAALDSPFFNSSFTTAVAAERGHVEVAVIERNGAVTGFLPYCRERSNIATPVAASFTDFQAVISAPNASFDMRRVLQDGRLSAWHFDHLVASQESLTPFHWAYAASPYMDLSQGFDSHLKRCRQSAGKELSEVFRKGRKLEREVAPIRFEAETTDERVLDTLIQWKRQQLTRQQRADCFRQSWVLPMLTRILNTHTGTFRPMLSAVYVGEELASINFGLRNGEVLHGWITAFNSKFRKFSPGLILMIKLAEVASSLGITRIDMGRGDESFKRNFSSGVTCVAEGAIDRRFMAGTLRHSWVRIKELLRRTSLGTPATNLLRKLRYAGERASHSLDTGR